MPRRLLNLRLNRKLAEGNLRNSNPAFHWLKACSKCSIPFLFIFFTPICVWARDAGLKFSASSDQEIIKLLELNEPTLVLTSEMAGYSFDPLDASLTKNIRLMRLLYETPLRFDKIGFICSNVLNRFHFDHEKGLLSFTLKDNLFYSDLTPVTILDLSLAIKRMLLSRPDHPALKLVKGAKKWQQKKFPLEHIPEGFSIKGKTLAIEYSGVTSQPLLWFTNEIFSIIPEKCINKQTNHLSCSIPPFSAEYELVQSDVPFLGFKRRCANEKKPEKINFVHISPVRIIKFMDHFRANHVVITDEIYVPPDHRSILMTRFRQNSIPESRIMALNMNQHTPPFNNIRVRQFFAKEYRKTLHTKFGQSDGGIFTRMMPGYIPLDVLGTRVPSFSEEEEKEIIQILKSHPPLWMVRAVDGDHDPFQFYISHTLKRLGLPVNRALERTRGAAAHVASWNQGKHNISRVYTGFGAPDPTHDLKMLFSKNMYFFLNDLYNDSILQSLIEKISHTSVENIDQQNLKNINLYLFEQAIFAPVINYTVAQYTLKDSPLRIINDFTSDASHYFMK